MKLDAARVRRAVQQVQAQFIENAPAHRVFTMLLTELVEISGSDFGFIGEVLEREQPRLKPLAVYAQLAVNSRQLGPRNGDGEAHALGMDALLDAVAAAGRPVLSPVVSTAREQDAATEQAFRAMTGVPLKCGSELVGLVGLGGVMRAAPMQPALHAGAGQPGAGPPRAMPWELLQPLLDTGAFLIQGYRSAGRVCSLERLAPAEADMGCVLGLDGTLKRADPALAALLGCSEAELTHLPLEHWVRPQDRAALARALEQLRREQPLADLTLQFLPRNGGPVWLCWRAAPDPGQQAVYALVRSVPPQCEAGAQPPELAAQTRSRLVGLGEMIQIESARG